MSLPNKRYNTRMKRAKPRAGTSLAALIRISQSCLRLAFCTCVYISFSPISLSLSLLLSSRINIILSRSYSSLLAKTSLSPRLLRKLKRPPLLYPFPLLFWFLSSHACIIRNLAAPLTSFTLLRLCVCVYVWMDVSFSFVLHCLFFYVIYFFCLFATTCGTL